MRMKTNSANSYRSVLQSLGLVFGDIGTSPIYTFTVIFLLTEPTEANIMGILSLIIWTLIIIVTGEYAWLAMSLSRKGEGGTIVLKEILSSLLKSKRKRSLVALIAFIGISLMIGDGVITPAISILSAVEGVLLVPGFESTSIDILVWVAALIAFILFSVQRKGTDKVAGAFGPIMLLWFLALMIFGLFSLLQMPRVILAINPWYAIHFFIDHGAAGILVLSQVILCATGGEALYADMGHLGRKPILRAWAVVFGALVVNYMGQAAFLLRHPEAKNILFGMVSGYAPLLYVPFLILSIFATVIASQAMISGMFSIVYQGIMTNIMPLFRVQYTSTEIRSQIYIGAVNWFLLAAVLLVMLQFKQSEHLAAAYGLAVNCDMVLTGVLMAWIFYLRNHKLKLLCAIIIVVIVVFFLWANIHKIPHGGYWSLVIAAFPFAIILTFTSGQKRLYRHMRPMDRMPFVQEYLLTRNEMTPIPGTALFFARGIDKVPPYIVSTMFDNGIIYENNIAISIVRRDDPFGIAWFYREDIALGLKAFEIQTGYMERPDIERILREANIRARTIFYGVEDIVTTKIVWQFFALIKRLSPSFVQFYRMPPHLLHGVVTRIEM
jgi:KUP system potassium uptake protein